MKKIKRNEWGLSEESIRGGIILRTMNGWNGKDHYILDIVVPKKLGDYVLGKRPVEPKLKLGFFCHSEKIQDYVEAKVRYHFDLKERRDREDEFGDYICSLYEKKHEVYVRFV